MSNLLALARDHLDRMANPAYGAAVNEEYSQRLASLLQEDRMRDQLQDELASVTDPGILTSHGWLWLLGWARSTRLQLSETLLAVVYDRWSNIFLKAATLEAALVGVGQTDLKELHPFTARLLDVATSPSDELLPTERGAATRRAEETLLALLHVESPATLAAARALLDRKWLGQERLEAYFNVLMNSLEESAAQRWREALRRAPGDRPLFR